MDYPIHLLPNINNKKIYWSEDLRPLFLIRHTRTEDIYLPDTNQVDLDKIELRSDHLKDLSMNLLGVFQVEDIYIEIKREKPRFFENWDEGSQVSRPVFNHDFCINEDRGYFFLCIDDVVNVDRPIKFENSDEIVAFNLCVLHTPTRCNFWHFSVRVLSQGKEIDDFNFSKKKKTQILRSMKNALSSLIQIKLDSSSHILAQEHYIISA